MSNVGKTMAAILAGAAVGAGIALLYAPDKGENTRERIADGAKKAKATFDDKYSETSSRLSQSAKTAKTKFDSRLEETLSSASYKADDVLDALEGKLEELRLKNSKFQKKHKNKETAETDTNAIV